MRHIIIFLSILLSFSCFDKKQSGVYISFKNGSNENFETFHVKIVKHDYYFNDLKSGKSTKPIKVEKTYRYCYAEAITKKDTVIFQPIDYVGETLHTSGRVKIEFYIFPEEGHERSLRIR